MNAEASWLSWLAAELLRSKRKHPLLLVFHALVGLAACSDARAAPLVVHDPSWRVSAGAPLGRSWCGKRVPEGQRAKNEPRVTVH